MFSSNCPFVVIVVQVVLLLLVAMFNVVFETLLFDGVHFRQQSSHESNLSNFAAAAVLATDVGTTVLPTATAAMGAADTTAIGSAGGGGAAGVVTGSAAGDMTIISTIAVDVTCPVAAVDVIVDGVANGFVVTARQWINIADPSGGARM